MKLNLDLRNQYLIILYFVTSIFVYWGLSQFNNLFANLVFGLVKIFGLPIILVFYANIILDLLILGVLVVLIVKGLRLEKFISEEHIPKFIHDIKKLRLLGILIIALVILVPLSNYLLQDSYELRIQEYYEANGNINYSVYFQLIPNIVDLLKNILIIITFFVLINKLPKAKESTKANKS